MEKKEEIKQRPSKIVLTNQNSLCVNGISKVLSNTESGISCIINNQVLNIEGEKISVQKLDVENGILEASGNITNVRFAKGKQKENFIKRIFG